LQSANAAAISFDSCGALLSTESNKISFGVVFKALQIATKQGKDNLVPLFSM
jgi:hypothetical protein